MSNITFTRTSKPAVGSLIQTPFGPKTLSQSDVDSLTPTITTETLDGDFSGLTGSSAAPSYTSDSIAANATIATIEAALATRIKNGGN